jgi:DNA-binding NarL/FixJ family response regulator
MHSLEGGLSHPPLETRAGTVRILVVDDHPVVRFGICHLIGSQPDFVVVGDVADSESALQILDKSHPDILLLDLQLDDNRSSYDLIGEVAGGGGESQVIIYTAHNGDARVVEAIRSGARGYVIKSSRPERVFEAIRVVARGGSYLDPSVSSPLMGHIRRRQDPRRNHGQDLTERERAVLKGLVSGKRNREIAERLFISERTVKYHIKSMFTKLHVKSRTELVKIALETGLV